MSTATESAAALARTFGPLVERICRECAQKGANSPANRAKYALISATEDVRFGDNVREVEMRLAHTLQTITAEQGIAHA